MSSTEETERLHNTGRSLAVEINEFDYSAIKALADAVGEPIEEIAGKMLILGLNRFMEMVE